MSDRSAFYDDFAEAFESHAENGAFNALYDRPAMLELAGEVEGLDVFDAGCGPGFYAQELVARGARVTAVDGSPEMVRLAQARLGPAADVRVADLNQPLTWLPSESQDLVVMALVIHHLDHRVAALRELHRVLRPQGRLVLSTTHPTTDWQRLGGSYFEVSEVEETWNSDWRVRYWRQPLERWCAEFAEAGFLIERLVEPRPVAAMAEAFPDYDRELRATPAFIAFRLLKP